MLLRRRLLILVLVLLVPLLARGKELVGSEVKSSTNVDIREILETVPDERKAYIENITNVLKPKKYKKEISLKVNLDPNYVPPLNEEPFFESFDRRYQIILIVSIPATYMVTKFLMEQVSVYNYKDFSRTLNTQQWAYIIASSVIIPLIVATEDYKKYKEFLETKF